MSAKPQPPRPTRKPPSRTRPSLTPISDEEIFGAAGMNGSQIGFLRNIPPDRAASHVPSPVPVPSGPVGTETVQAQATEPVGTYLVGSDRVGSGPVTTVYPPMAANDAVGTDAEPSVPVDIEGPARAPVPTRSVGGGSVATASVGTGSVPKGTAVLCGPHPSQRRFPVACTTAAEGHTPAEQTIYEILWKAAGKWGREDADGARLLRFKQPWLAQLARMHENSVRNLLKSLTTKLAIEETARSGPAQGREVRIYGEAALFERRRSRGLVWAVRSHGVTLLTPAQVQQMIDPCVPVGTDIVGTGRVDTAE